MHEEVADNTDAVFICNHKICELYKFHTLTGAELLFKLSRQPKFPRNIHIVHVREIKNISTYSDCDTAVSGGDI